MTTPTATLRTWGNTTFRAAVGDAVLAPSIHNSQPWRFRRTAAGIDVMLDRGRLLPACDPTGRAARVSCGAAVYNLRLALAVAGTPATWRLGPRDLIAQLTPDRPRPPTPAERRMQRAIGHRRTNRYPFADVPVEPGVPATLIDAARAESGWLDLAIGGTAIDAVAALDRAADTILRQDPAYVAELSAWTRDTDGLPEGVEPSAAGPAPHPAELMARRDFGGRPLAETRDDAREPVLAVLGVHGDLPSDEVQAGMALQHVLLTATDLGLATALFSQPIEVPAVREQLRLALGRRYLPQMVLRFGYAPAIGASSRRPVEDVIDQGM